jgi:hypothetical protein
VGLQPTLLVCGIGAKVTLVGSRWFGVMYLQMSLEVGFLFEGSSTEMAGKGACIGLSGRWMGVEVWYG